MYTEEYLSTYPYFRDLLATKDLSSLHDSLTGLIARPYMIRFIHSLIDAGTPFYLAILDLDNFKSINDYYGHAVGDGVLAKVSESLRDYVGRDGVVGRFGGDEFLLLYFKSIEYDDMHTFFQGMYHKKTVLRRNVDVEALSLFVTGTVGSACYPKDAVDYDTLFSLVDKTLYRGKSKGRNCYIIYVAAKHADLEIKKLAKRSLYDTFREMGERFDQPGTPVEKIQSAFVPMRENLRFWALYYVNQEGQLVDGNGAVQADAVEICWDGLERVHALDRLGEMEKISPVIYQTLSPLRYQTAMLARVEGAGRVYGSLIICPEPRTLRIWQEEEKAAAFFLARMLSDYMDALQDGN